MYKLRLREDRGKTTTKWLKSAHTFSFAQYFDPFNMGFSDLRVINDDIVAPDGGFGLHPHANMEIISVVLQGQLEHKDSTGEEKILNPGDIQVMTAGSGVMHSEFNPSSENIVHFLQIWILPYKKNLNPSYDQKHFSKESMLNKLCLVVSDDARHGSLKINQNALVYQSVIEADKTIIYDMPENRKFWIQVAQGAIEVNSNILEAGDGISIVNESGLLEIEGVDIESNFLLFDLRNLTV
ncbi:MAG: pirin family protein [Clostridium sp.]|nr:pirin family protein [Clostridium sp.]